ncbi:MAG: hypothetical protein IKC64_00395, partial [Clostridia bacterium]|nr:hypothetical protein [Clostridia bacterium]
TSNISILVNFDINADYVKKITSYDDAMKFVRKVKRKSIGNAIREVIWPIITGVISYACVSAIALIVSKTVPFVAYLYDFAILDLIIAVPLHALMLLIVYLWILAKHVGNKRAIAIIEHLTDTCFWSKCPQCGGLIVHEILEKWTEKGKMIAPERNEWVSNKNTTSYYEVNGERVTVTEKDYGGHWEKHEAVYEVLTIAKIKETCRQCKSTQIIERDVTTALEKQKKYLEKYLQNEKVRGKSLPKETPVKEKTYEKYKKM